MEMIMTHKVLSGLDVLLASPNLTKEYPGKVALLCHSASVTKNIDHALLKFQDVFGDQLIKIFGPQHGLVSDVQDNMVETNHCTHPYLNKPIYSLYSETRIPTDEMLEGIDHIFVDLQDVGTRIYTYIYTLTYLLEACEGKDIEVIVLDRPNPIGGLAVEGNILKNEFSSFVGRHPLPVRHGLTIGEVAIVHQSQWANSKVNLKVIKMENWERSFFFEDTGLPWVLPSPNLPTVDGCFTFPGTVLFEGCSSSEGRGTTRALEILGDPNIEPFSFRQEVLSPLFKKYNLTGFTLRPLYFMPTFQKHAGSSCGGYQIHVTNRKSFEPWKVGQVLMYAFYHHVKGFKWKQPPYEYIHDKLPIDVINGDDQIRLNLENHHLQDVLATDNSEYTNNFKNLHLYP